MVEERLLNWFGAVEHVPDSVIREISKVKKIDHHYEQIMDEIEETTEENKLAKLLIKLQQLTDMKLQIVGSINDTFGDATDAVRTEFRKIEHESQVFDPRGSERKVKESKEDSPGKNKKETDRRKDPKKRPRSIPKPDKEQRIKEERDARKRHKRENEKKQSNDSNDKEETYCFCKQVSYGQMVCCDNSKCDIMWFHFSCVGLQHKPKGKWFCTDACKVTIRPGGSGRGRKRRDSDHDI